MEGEFADEDLSYKTRNGHIRTIKSEYETFAKYKWKGKKLKKIVYYVDKNEKEIITFKNDKKSNPKSATAKHYYGKKVIDKRTFKYKNIYKKGRLIKRITKFKYNGKTYKKSEKYKYKKVNLDPMGYKVDKPCIE